MPALMRWGRINLFASPLDTALSVVFIPLCAWLAWALGEWALRSAHWRVVTDNLRVLLAGTYPLELVQRPLWCAVILSALSGLSMGAVARLHRRLGGVLLWLAAAATLFLAVQGDHGLTWSAACVLVAFAGWAATAWYPTCRRYIGPAWLLGLVANVVLLSAAGPERWGGLLLSILMTVLAAGLSVPLGIALAFGRRSRFASLRILCAGYIEVMRSLPLILVVYWVWVIAPLLSPQHPGPDLVRGLLGFTLFFGAYVAEYVRSGLQSIPKGQVEAAQSLGMSAFALNRDVVLPQAARVVMPALVGNVLDIFNTVPLLFIIGLTDFLRAGQMILVNPQSGGRSYEVYLFMFAVYLCIASAITYGARRLETSLSVAGR
jgi:general L-amino acid transport system permease protein